MDVAMISAWILMVRYNFKVMKLPVMEETGRNNNEIFIPRRFQSSMPPFLSTWHGVEYFSSVVIATSSSSTSYILISLKWRASCREMGTFKKLIQSFLCKMSINIFTLLDASMLMWCHFNGHAHTHIYVYMYIYVQLINAEWRIYVSVN